MRAAEAWGWLGKEGRSFFRSLITIITGRPKVLVLLFVWPSGTFTVISMWFPLQYSCLENPMDGGAWWATVHGVSKSRTRLSDLNLTMWISFSSFTNYIFPHGESGSLKKEKKRGFLVHKTLYYGSVKWYVIYHPLYTRTCSVRQPNYGIQAVEKCRRIFLSPQFFLWKTFPFIYLFIYIGLHRDLAPWSEYCWSEYCFGSTVLSSGPPGKSPDSLLRCQDDMAKSIQFEVARRPVPL